MKRLLFFLLIPPLTWAAEYPQSDLNNYISQNDEPIVLSTDTCASGRTCHTLPSSCDVLFDKDDPTTDTLAEIEALLVPTSTDRVFCFDSGDDWTTLGDTLNLPSDGDCTSENRCWIINAWNVEQQDLGYSWDQTATNQVTFDDRWQVGGGYWVIAYMRWDGGTGNPINIVEGLSDTIIHGNENNNWGSSGVSDFVQGETGAGNVLIQNNYAHDWNVAYSTELKFLNVHSDTDGSCDNWRIVNNEVGNLVFGFSSNDVGSANDYCDNIIVENNDFYVTPDYYTDCSGNQDSTGGCAWAKLAVSFKVSGINAGHLNQVINNRIWGWRRTDRTDPGGCCLSTTDGAAFEPSAGGTTETVSYTLFHNNTVEDSQKGYQGVSGAGNNSLVGNLFYNFQDFSGQSNSWSVRLNNHDDDEIYLNTFIYGGENGVFRTTLSNTNNDQRCNVLILGANSTFTGGTGTEADYNVFYGTAEFATESPDNNIDKSSTTEWAASTTYSIGDVVFPTETPGDAGFDEATHGYMMVATAGGTSGSTEPTWPTTLGDTVTDNGVTWKTIRAPYVYWRKLLSTPEQSTIPYAKALADSDLPEYDHCAGSGMGDRTGIGVDDTTPSWN